MDKALVKWVEQIAKVLDGSAGLKLLSGPGAAPGADKDVDISVTGINAAAAYTVRKQIWWQLVDANGVLQEWFNGTVEMTATETVNDAQVGAPKLYDASGGAAAAAVALVIFTGGMGTAWIAFDSDAAADKEYIATDFCTVTPTAFNVNGVAVTLTDGTPVFTFVA